MVWGRNMVRECYAAWTNYVKIYLGFVNNEAQPELLSFQTQPIIIIIIIIIFLFKILAHLFCNLSTEKRKFKKLISEMSIQDNLYIFLVLYNNLADNLSLSFALFCKHFSLIHSAVLFSKKQIDKMCSRVVQTRGIQFNNNITNKRQIDLEDLQKLHLNEYRNDSKRPGFTPDLWPSHPIQGVTFPAPGNSLMQEEMDKPQLPISPWSPDTLAGTSQQSITAPMSKVEGGKDFCQRHSPGYRYFQTLAYSYCLPFVFTISYSDGMNSGVFSQS